MASLSSLASSSYSAGIPQPSLNSSVLDRIENDESKKPTGPLTLLFQKIGHVSLSTQVVAVFGVSIALYFLIICIRLCKRALYRPRDQALWADPRVPADESEPDPTVLNAPARMANSSALKGFSSMDEKSGDGYDYINLQPHPSDAKLSIIRMADLRVLQERFGFRVQAFGFFTSLWRLFMPLLPWSEAYYEDLSQRMREISLYASSYLSGAF